LNRDQITTLVLVLGNVGGSDSHHPAMILPTTSRRSEANFRTPENSVAGFNVVELCGHRFDPFGYRCRSAIIIQSKSAMSTADLKDFHDLVISGWYH